jgi:hypothetical protein
MFPKIVPLSKVEDEDMCRRIMAAMIAHWESKQTIARNERNWPAMSHLTQVIRYHKEVQSLLPGWYWTGSTWKERML